MEKLNELPEVEWVSLISEHHPAAPYVAVFDKDGNFMKKVISYNLETKEVTRYQSDENGKTIISTEGGLLTETFIAEGSTLKFRVNKAINQVKE